MCSRGIFQLKQLQLIFCDYSGSSARLREFIPTLVDHKILNEPVIDLKLLIKRGVHPLLKAYYINGYQKQISLKNIQEEQELIEKIKFLRNSFGSSCMTHAGKKVISITPSVQGRWNESLFPAHPRHEMEIQRTFPKVIVPEPEYIPKIIPLTENRKEPDPYKSMLKPNRGARSAGDY